MILLYSITFTIIFQEYSAWSFDKYRLPNNVKPFNYNLDISVNPDSTHFIGKVKITVQILNGSTNNIFLHADHDYIDIESIQLNGFICNSSIHENPDTQIMPIICPAKFSTGHNLIIQYKGKFSKEMNGFYKSHYDNKLLVATQLQPIYARRVFPCFDEPIFKATFEVTIRHPTNYRALANMPLEEAIVTRNFTTTKFQKTPIMSTYLLAIIVSQMEPAIPNDPDFNIFARSSAAANLGVAKKFGEKIFDCMSQWTGIRYESLGNPQKYLVAIPDFSAGAMENWGLITFRELDLLDNGMRTSSESFQMILFVMAHEIAHQWFGNYVTLNWWSNTWLNEGFANYFGKVAANMVMNGVLEIDKQATVEVTQRIMEKDAASTTTALSTPMQAVRTSLEINLKFDEISYLKGECITRMMSNILGEETFKIGIQNYLTQNKYKNVNPTDLLNALQQAAGNKIHNFTEKMYNWVYQPGFPLVTLSRVNDSAINIVQERFCVEKGCNSTTKWFIPITYTTQKTKNFTIKVNCWLEPNKTLQIYHNKEEWIIFNIQISGFYRVNYDDTLWEQIIDAFNNETERKSINALNRAQIIDDIYHIAKIGRVSYNKAFNLAQYLKTETNYYPWVSAIKSFSYFLDNMDYETEKLLKNWLLTMVLTTFSDTKNLNHIETLHKSMINEFACKLGNTDCLNYAKRQFLAFKKDTKSVPVNNYYLILCYGLIKSDTLENDYNFLINLFHKSPAFEQFKILSALGCMPDKNLLNRYLNLTLYEPSPIRQQDFGTVFNSVYLNNKAGIEVALDFMYKNFKAMELAYGGPNVLTSLMLDIAEKISSSQNVEKMRKILNYYKDNENIKLKGQSVLDIINANQDWKFNYEKEIKQYLESTKSHGQQHKINFIVIVCFLMSQFIFY